MLYTEEEAREKTCVIPGREFCVASQCMAWQWQEPLARDKRTGALFLVDQLKKNYTDMDSFEILETMGYCGLAERSAS